MNERVRATNGYHQQYHHNVPNKLSPDLIGPKRSIVVVVIVVGCFAVLWPKVFQPMFFGVAEEYMKPNALDRTNGCCDIVAEKDINTIKIMSELCSHIDHNGTKGALNKQIVAKCKEEVLKTCGIDISPALQQNLRLGRSVKQIIDEVRSLNGSLCLKYNYGVAPWALGVQHKIASSYKPTNVRQERPHNLRPEMMHPAFRERGSAIPHGPSPKPVQRQVIDGRPGPVPGMRPPMGGAGGVIAPSQKGSSMGIIMPIYTIGIVVFFTYTLMKVLFKKQSDGMQNSLYPPIDPDPGFRRDVFDNSHYMSHMSRDTSNNSKIGDEELDQLKKRLRETEVAMQRIVNQMAQTPLASRVQTDPSQCANGTVQTEEQPKVTVMGMETTASCEGGKKWTKKDIPGKVTPPAINIPEPPQEIFLEGALPAQSKILVSDAKTEAEEVEDDPAVVLAGKMTLSVISLDAAEDDAEKRDEEDAESKYTTVSGMTAAEHEDIAANEENQSEGHDDTDEEEIIEDLGDDRRNPE